MPFKSEKQRRACWATHGFHGAIDCHEWAHAKKDMGGTNMKYRGKKKYQIGGDTPCYDAIGNEIPCPGKEMTNVAGNAAWYQPQPNEQPMTLPQANPLDLATSQGTPSPFEANPIRQGSKGWEIIPDYRREKQDPFFAIQGATTGLSWLSGLMERKRQDKYMQQQMAQLNQMNPMPSTDFQPNPFSLYAKYGGSLKKYATGGSIVDYLASKGQKNSFEDRRGIFSKYFGDEHYTGSAEQNLRLLGTLQTKGPIKDNPPSPAASPFSYQRQQPQTKQPAISRPAPPRPAAPAASAPSTGKLQSGTIVDKRTGKQYLIQNGQIAKTFNVLTGKNPEGNRNDYSMARSDRDPSTRNTPVGNYFMRPDANVYGMPGFEYQPIQAFGQPAPLATGIFEHITYPKEKAIREPLYGSATPWASQGCVNAQGQTIDCLAKTFPKGDTTTVIDTKTKQGMNILNQYRPKGYGGVMRGGGKWIQKAVNPKHRGFCSPMTKSTCTPRRKALARTFKKHHGFHE